MMASGFRRPAETFLTEIAQNQLAPLWKIHQTLVIEEPNRSATGHLEMV